MIVMKTSCRFSNIVTGKTMKQNLAKVKPVAHSLGITYPVLLDVNSEVMALLNVTAVPTLLVVNAEREIVLLHEGYRPGDARHLGKELERLLGLPSAEE